MGNIDIKKEQRSRIAHRRMESDTFLIRNVRTAIVARGRGYRNFQGNDGRRPEAGLHATKDAGLPPQFDIEKKELGKRRENG